MWAPCELAVSWDISLVGDQLSSFESAKKAQMKKDSSVVAGESEERNLIEDTFILVCVCCESLSTRDFCFFAHMDYPPCWQMEQRFPPAFSFFFWVALMLLLTCLKKRTGHEFHETCHSVTFIAVVNLHQRWKQTRNRVCFHLWCELTLALWCHSSVWSLLSWNKM